MIGSHLHHLEGHDLSIWDYKCPWQNRCLRALHVSPFAGRASEGPPVAHICCANHHVWEVAPRLLPSASLSEEPDCPPHHDPSEGHCYKSHSANWVPPVAL